jgi:hypothetical protein
MLLHSKLIASPPARALMLASVAALTLSSISVQAASAAPQSPAAPQQAAPATDSEFGARKRYRRGNAAGLAMMGLMVGTVGAVIAAQHRRERYERAYAAPRYYGGYGGGYPHAYSHPHAYVQQHGYVQRRGSAFHNYDVPGLNPPGVINYGPPRIGW